jgi:hypothetical protein
MKWVSLLVFLMVSLIELELERYRLYLFCSTAALAALVCNVLINRRGVQNARKTRAFEKGKQDSGCLSPEQSGVAQLSCSLLSEDGGTNDDSANHTLGGAVLMRDRLT